MKIDVRDAERGDAAVLCEYNRLLALETEARQLPREVVLRGVNLAFDRPELCRYFVAEADHQAVGVCMVTYEWTDWRAGVLWWFQSVYVDREHRRRGVFRALYNHVHALARGLPEVCGLRLYVEQHNRPAQATYARLGMQPSGHVVYELDWSTSGEGGS